MTVWLAVLLAMGVVLAGIGVWLIATSRPRRQAIIDRVLATQLKWLADGHELVESYVGLDVVTADRLAASESTRPVRTLRLPLMSAPPRRRNSGQLTLLVVGDQVAQAYVER